MQFGPTSTPLPEWWVTPTVTPIPEPVELPESAFIEGFEGYAQERALNCEFRSAVDLSAHFGFDIEWEALFLAIGHDPNGDPNVGFVGTSFDDLPGSLYPNGYGVYAGPLARGLTKLGVPALAHDDCTEKWLKRHIAESRPVLIWANYGMSPATPETWRTRDGTKTVVGVPGEHTFTVIGYDSQRVWLSDPFDGAEKSYSWDDFLRSWSYLGRMAVTIEASLDR